MSQYHKTTQESKYNDIHKSAFSPTVSDQILVVLSSSFQDTELYIISRRGPKMSLIHEDYVSQNLHQSAELNCLPAKGGGTSKPSVTESASHHIM